MPHRDRQARLRYLTAYRAANRPSPAVELQVDADLPPRGTVRFSEDGTSVQCHACGRWLRSLNTHLRIHGLDASSYKETYDLARTASLWPPALRAKQSEAAIARDQGAIGRSNIPPATGRPKGTDNRLSVRIEASEIRKGVYTRGGNRTRRK